MDGVERIGGHGSCQRAHGRNLSVQRIELNGTIVVEGRRGGVGHGSCQSAHGLPLSVRVM